jgi:effector-binding domain-containing protein
MNEPRMQERTAQSYLAIPARVATEAEFRRATDSGFPELFGWLAEHGVKPAGPPFIRYRAMDADGDPREVEMGVPVTAGVEGEGRIRADVLPAGRYVTLLHVGPYSSATEPDLRAAHGVLLEWADRHGVVYEREADGGSAPTCWVERYITGPMEEPDHARWQTELAYLAD